jgi:hypothetical protein
MNPSDLTTQQVAPEEVSEQDRQEANAIVARWDKLDAEAINWKTHWQECYEYIVPRKQDVIATRLPGDRRDSDIFDATPVLSNEKLAAALHSMLTNPESRFFDIVYDPKIMEMEEVRNYCQDVGDIIFKVLNNTNFQTEVYEIYIDLGAIGTACLYMDEHDTNFVHFSARAMKEIRITENNLGLVDVVSRSFKWRAAQIIQEFGRNAIPNDIVRAAESGSSDQFEVLHEVSPLSELERHTSMMPFKSTYVLKTPRKILSRGRYNEFPYAVPRWSKTTGEIYGRGPGMSMLPDIMMLNAMMLTVIQGAQKTVDPPLMVTDDGVIGNVRLTPGGLTVIRAGEENLIKPLITDARIDFGEKLVDSVRTRIREGFFVDQLQLKDGPQMTAEEARIRAEHMLRLMGPVLGRQHFEFLRPVITRVYNILERRGQLPPKPAVLQNRKFDVRYSSLIARAQRISEGQNIARAFALIQPLLQVKPQMADLVDEERLGRFIWALYGNSHTLLKSKQELKKVQMQRQAAMEQAQEQQNQLHASEVGKNMAPVMEAAKPQMPGGM